MNQGVTRAVSRAAVAAMVALALTPVAADASTGRQSSGGAVEIEIGDNSFEHGEGPHRAAASGDGRAEHPDQGREDRRADALTDRGAAA